MNNEPSGSPARLIIIVGVALVITLVAVLTFRNYVSEAQEPTPTLVPSAVAEVVLPSATATETSTATSEPPTTLPLTNTPRAGASSTSLPEEDEDTPTRTPRPTDIPILSPTPTSRPQIMPSLAVLTGTKFVMGGGVPTAVPTFQVPLGTTNVLLLGSDIGLDEGVGRTDTMIILAINRDGPTASMVSLPRDLWVYIPGWTNNRLNTALSRGSSAGYPGGAVAQLKDTILYNFGVPIHYYAQVDFEGFKEGIDLIDGVDIAVSCQLRDWRLKSPELNPDNEDNWHMFTLKPGVHRMDGDMALWYARSRLTTSDFDRGRRQQQLLRAALSEGVDLGILSNIPELWGTYQDAVKTDMDIGRMLQFAALAPEVQENGIQHLYIVGNQLEPYIVPSSGAHVQVPVWSEAQNTFRRLFLPPALNKASRPPITVEIINGTDNPDLPLLAADNLAWYGFEPVIVEDSAEPQKVTSLQYNGQNFKGSFDWLFSWIMDKRLADIELVSDTPSDYDYRVVLGKDYDPCRPQLFAPQIYLGQQ